MSYDFCLQPGKLSIVEAKAFGNLEGANRQIGEWRRQDVSDEEFERLVSKNTYEEYGNKRKLGWKRKKSKSLIKLNLKNVHVDWIFWVSIDHNLYNWWLFMTGRNLFLYGCGIWLLPSGIPLPFTTSLPILRCPFARSPSSGSVLSITSQQRTRVVDI